MQLLVVEKDADIRLFHKLPGEIYRGDPVYIYPLEKDIEFVFDRHRNPLFQSGDAIRYVIVDNRRKPIGRIAAFYEELQLEDETERLGGFGFFECVEDEAATAELFRAAADWLRSKGCHQMEGPMNFGERDQYWGLLLEGEESPSYLENYHPPYYQSLFENAGLEKVSEHFTFKISRDKFNAKRFSKVAEWILRKPGFRFRHYHADEKQELIRDFVKVYNKAKASEEEFRPMTEGRVMALTQAMRHIMIDDFIWFAYVHGQPAGIMVLVPDINDSLRAARGRLNWISRWRLQFALRNKRLRRARGLVFAIDPDYDGYGLETVLIYKFYRVLSLTNQYREVELTWAGEFSEKIASLMKNLQAEHVKTHGLYRLKL